MNLVAVMAVVVEHPAVQVEGLAAQEAQVVRLGAVAVLVEWEAQAKVKLAEQVVQVVEAR